MPELTHENSRRITAAGNGRASIPDWLFQAFSALVADIYQSAASAESFEPMLRDIASLVGSDAAAFYCWEKSAGRCELIDMSVTPPDTPKDMAWLAELAGYCRPLPHFGSDATAMVFSDDIGTDVSTGGAPTPPPAELDDWDAALMWIFEDARTALAVCTVRRKSRGHFSDVDKRILAELRPHLSRAFSLCRLIERHEWNEAAGMEVLDHLHTGVVMVDRRGRTYAANLAAERLCRNGQGLRLTRRGINATSSDTNEQLQAAIRNAHSNAESGNVTSVKTVSIARSSSQTPMVVNCISIPGQPKLFLANQPRVILLLRDPDCHLETAESVLEKLYGLTHCESRIASGIADGQSIKQLVHDLEVTDTTVRNTLKRVFQKMRVHSQGELASLVGKTLLP